MNEPGELSREDWLGRTARRAIDALKSGEKDFAEELLIDILYLIGRGPKEGMCEPSPSSESSPSGSSSTA